MLIQEKVQHTHSMCRHQTRKKIVLDLFIFFNKLFLQFWERDRVREGCLQCALISEGEREIIGRSGYFGLC